MYKLYKISHNIIGDPMNEIMRTNEKDDLSNRSINNQLKSKVNINKNIHKNKKNSKKK